MTWVLYIWLAINPDIDFEGRYPVYETKEECFKAADSIGFLLESFKSQKLLDYDGLVMTCIEEDFE